MAELTDSEMVALMERAGLVAGKDWRLAPFPGMKGPQLAMTATGMRKLGAYLEAHPEECGVRNPAQVIGEMLRQAGAD